MNIMNQKAREVNLQGLRGALNAMLFRTGDQSRDFAVVLATNRPADLDAAVIDRMDEAIEFPLPGEGERQQILRMYIDSYIAKAGTSEGERPQCLLCISLVPKKNSTMRYQESRSHMQDKAFLSKAPLHPIK